MRRQSYILLRNVVVAYYVQAQDAAAGSDAYLNVSYIDATNNVVLMSKTPVGDASPCIQLETSADSVI